MKRKQIIEILGNELQDGNIEMHHINIEQLAEKLALPLEVPDSDFLLDILLKVNEYVRQENQFIATEYVGVFKEWMRDEIIKRNRVI